MKILTLDTATEACSAALLDGEKLYQRYEIAPRNHTKLILPMIEALLEASGLVLKQLDALAFGKGPGSFTGVRIAAATAQGVAFGAGELKVIPVSTLATMAQRAMDEFEVERVACAIDARMKEVYWGCYQRNEQGLAEVVVEDCVIPPANVPQPEGDGWLAVGTGWGAYEEALMAQLDGQVTASHVEYFPSAAAMTRLAVAEWHAGNSVDAEQALPVYLRDKVAQVPKGMKPVVRD